MLGAKYELHLYEDVSIMYCHDCDLFKVACQSYSPWICPSISHLRVKQENCGLYMVTKTMRESCLPARAFGELALIARSVVQFFIIQYLYI